MMTNSLALDVALTPLQYQITEKIKSFDLTVLLRTLFHMGYDWKNLRFFSVGITHSADSLCEDILFSEHTVDIFLNLGLLCANSPLPSFFFKLMDMNTIGGERFQKYLHFFDHHLLKNLLQATFIEKNRTLFPSWQEAKHNYLMLTGLDSLTSFTWLIQLVYPDFETEVKKQPKVIPIRESAFSLGKPLGKNSILGGNATKTYASFRVVITTDDPCYKIETPWPIEIRRRLKEYILPLLQRVEIHLALLLVIRGHEGRMELSHHSHLGFEPLGKRGAPFELLVYYGRIKNQVTPKQ